jgi:hypothetical protein
LGELSVRALQVPPKNQDGGAAKIAASTNFCVNLSTEERLHYILTNNVISATWFGSFEPPTHR